jgi:hypothetical protein
MRALPIPIAVVGVVVGIVVVAGVAIAVSVHYVPVQRSFLLYDPLAVDPLTCWPDITPMAGTVVTFHWWATNSTDFDVWNCGNAGPGSGGPPIYYGNGTNGSSSFEAYGGGYMFGVLCTAWCAPPATVAGNYTAYLLVL